MDIFFFLAASLLAYSGVFLGYLLLLISPEERKPLRKYLIILRNLSLLFALAAGAWIFSYYLLISLLIAAGAIILFFTLLRREGFRETTMIGFSLFLGVLFTLSYDSQPAFIIMFLCVLLYGMATTLLEKGKGIEPLKRSALPHLCFLAGALITYFSY